MKDPIILEGEAILHSRNWQLAVTVDGTALTEVFEQDIGLTAEIKLGDSVIGLQRTKRVRVTIQELEEGEGQ